MQQYRRKLKSRYGLILNAVLLALFTILAFGLFFAADAGVTSAVVILLAAITTVMVVTVLLG